MTQLLLAVAVLLGACAPMAGGGLEPVYITHRGATAHAVPQATDAETP